MELSIDREKVIKELRAARLFFEMGSNRADGVVGNLGCKSGMQYIDDALELLKEQKSFLGVQQTVDSITFISTGTSQQGEERGLMLGKAFMHEWIYKELLYKGLLTDDIQSVFEQAKHI